MNDAFLSFILTKRSHNHVIAKFLYGSNYQCYNDYHSRHFALQVCLNVFNFLRSITYRFSSLASSPVTSTIAPSGTNGSNMTAIASTSLAPNADTTSATTDSVSWVILPHSFELYLDVLGPELDDQTTGSTLRSCWCNCCLSRLCVSLRTKEKEKVTCFESCLWYKVFYFDLNLGEESQRRTKSLRRIR